MNQDDFEKKIKDFASSEEHIYKNQGCVGHSEGQLCCLELEGCLNFLWKLAEEHALDKHSDLSVEESEQHG